LGQVELILLTHHHHDHSESARELAARTGAPVRAADPSLCVGGEPLRPGETMVAGGATVHVYKTPGHTADSVCFHLPDDSDLGGHQRQAGSMLTGDTLLGVGSTVIASGDGSLSDYLRSLSKLAAIGPAVVLPGHGPKLDDLGRAATAGLEHRAARLGEVAAAVNSLEATGAPNLVTVEAVTDIVYAHVAIEVRHAAEATVAAQLEYIAHLAQRPYHGRESEQP
jgi:glyoxylase-like metal-dependent hydrolase (beta-lactamase superfamily II)